MVVQQHVRKTPKSVCWVPLCELLHPSSPALAALPPAPACLSPALASKSPAALAAAADSPARCCSKGDSSQAEEITAPVSKHYS